MATQLANAKPRLAVVAKSADKPELIKAIRYYVQQLGLDSTTYIVVRYSMNLPSEVDGTMQYRATGQFGHQVLITINRKNSPLNRLLALAHELIHARQYIEGRLQNTGNGAVSWKGTDFTHIHDVDYTARPWEYEALTTSRHLRRSYLKHLKAEKRNKQLFVAVN